MTLIKQQPVGVCCWSKLWSHSMASLFIEFLMWAVAYREQMYSARSVIECYSISVLQVNQLSTPNYKYLLDRRQMKPPIVFSANMFK